MQLIVIDVEKMQLIMARKCMTWAALAQASGITAQSLRGKNPRFTLKTIRRIAQGLGVDVTEIIKRTGSDSQLQQSTN